MSFTVITIGKVVVPPEFVPVTVYVAILTANAGVPEISPVVAFNINPAGSDGLTAKLIRGEPILVGLIVAIVVPIVNTLGVVYAKPDGALSLTKIVKVVLTLPLLFVALTVYVVNSETANGVPLITPVAVLKVNPTGNEGIML